MELALSDIDHVEFDEYSESTDVTIHTLDRKAIRVSSAAFPTVPRATEVLDVRDVRARRAGCEPHPPSSLR